MRLKLIIGVGIQADKKSSYWIMHVIGAPMNAALELKIRPRLLTGLANTCEAIKW